MENSILFSEDPERTADYKAMQASLYPRGSTVDSKQRGENATAHRVGGWKDPRKRDKKAKRNRGYGAMKSKLMSKEENLLENSVNDIIKTGVTGFLNKNKNINLGDLTSTERRKKAGDQLKKTFKSSALDTGQNIINHLQKNEYQWEEVSRRKKPSALKKKAKLNAALEKLKKARASVQENTAQFDKLVRTIKNTPDLSKEKTAKLLRIAGKVRGLGESRVMNSSSIEKSGPTIDVTATEVKDKKKGENSKKREKGGPITQKQNPRVGEPDGPDDKRTKRGERKLKAIDKLTDKRKEKIKSGLKTGAKVANASAKVAGYVGSKAKSGISAFTSGYDAKEEKTFSQYTENALAINAIQYGLPAAVTAVGAIGTYLQSRKKSPGQTNLFPKGSTWNPTSQTPRAKSAKAKSNRKSGAEAEARANAERGSYDKSIEPGDNPEAREGIRKILDKLNKKNNKLYKDYNNPKP